MTKKAVPNKVSSDFDKSRKTGAPAPEPKFGKVPARSKPSKMPPMSTYDQGVRSSDVDKFGLETPPNANNGDNRQSLPRASEETIS
jgi:hypothetical protein